MHKFVEAAAIALQAIWENKLRSFLTVLGNIVMGRATTPTEFDSGRFVANLGYDTADKLFGAVDPIDKIVSVNGIHFQVVGVAVKKGSVFGQSQDEFAVIPLVAFLHVFGTR